MVTSNKLPDKKVVKMAEQNNSVVVPQRTLLGDINVHITCPLCRGYYIDATTIVECLHSFCRSCIIKHLQVNRNNSYCPVCEMMINPAKPNIKLDKALQDIVYKLVPGLFQKEMERRQKFYASRPGPAASATPEQRGEDTERIIFSPEDVISFSLEYADATDTDSISSKSSDSNETQTTPAIARRYMQCPAVVNISHLKKFLCMKFDIDSTQFAIDILYKRVPLPDYYTLMDIAYIYNWKRNEPMRFFYQIIDYVAIRNRLFDINRKSSLFHDRKPSPASTDVNSPAPNLNDQGSEASSGTDSPMPDDNTKQVNNYKKTDKPEQHEKCNNEQEIVDVKVPLPPSNKKNDDDVEKSQFLNSFELTAKNNSASTKSPLKADEPQPASINESTPKSQNTSPKAVDSLKRKHQSLLNLPEMKKLKIELEKTKLPDLISNPSTSIIGTPSLTTTNKNVETPGNTKEVDNGKKSQAPLFKKVSSSSTTLTKEAKPQGTPGKQNPIPDSSGTKRPVPISHSISPKRKHVETTSSTSSLPTTSVTPKMISPLKLQVPKLKEEQLTSHSTIDTKHEIQQKPVKKIPDLKPSVPTSSTQNKGQPVNKLRMDLLANNSDPTIDRSKILSHVKVQNLGQPSGDPLKSLFDSCKINIPSSLSITLTDQKLDPRNPTEVSNNDSKKNVVNKNLAGANNTTAHKVPSPPVHNSIEILKLPDTVSKKQTKTEANSDKTTAAPNRNESIPIQTKPPTKSSEGSAKGPIPNLKPIADTKLGKTTANFSSPITFQQTFEKQLQSLQTDKKPKLPKTKAQVPKLVPATPKAFSAVSKLSSAPTKPSQCGSSTPEKPSSALDLSTPHNIQSQLSPHQTKAFETMQSIANLAKKQSIPPKSMPLPIPQNFPNRPVMPTKIPNINIVSQLKHDVSASNVLTNTSRQDLSSKTQPKLASPNINPNLNILPQNYQSSHGPLSATQPSPRSQTRSPSSSPKLVIAEERQTSNPPEQNMNQSNQITSTQLANISLPKSESPKPSPGSSKPLLKTMKPLSPASKLPGIRQSITPTVKLNPSSADLQLISAHHQAILRHQMEMNWIKAQRQFELYKNMSSMAHQAQNEYNKDKQ